MNSIFQQHLWKFVIIFFNDILIYSTNQKEHLQHLEVVLNLLQQYVLFAHHNKCSFGVEKLAYLGYVVIRFK